MKLKSKLKTITALLVFAVYLFTNQAVTAQMIYTYASEAAKEKLTYEELIEHGDLSGDNEINVYDVRRAKVALLNNEIPSPDGDVNNDGEFSQADMQVLQDYVLMRDIWKYKDKEKTDDPAVSVNTELEYPVFSSDDGDSISITAESININQDVASNGNVSINGEYREDFPHIKSNVGLDPFYMDYALYNAKFSDSDIYDVFSDEINFIVEKPVVVHSDIKIEKEMTVSSTYMMSYNDITIDNGNINSGDAVLYSKYGDITIDSDAINLVGLIYAPNGSVKLTGNHVHVNGYIIAKNVIIESESELNIDPSRPLSDILGTASVEAEELSIPFEEWEYIEKDEDEVFPEIVKAQIYNNPLSVDDAWLTENYGEEVVKAYNKDMKKELVEALYIGQSEGIANYHDIVFTLDFAARYDLFEKIRLVTELPDNEPGKITIKFGGTTVRTIRVAGSDFVGPLPYDCYYKWDFYLDANDNPELKGADPDEPDKTIFKIHDFPEFTKRVFDGSTVLNGAEDAAGGTLVVLSGFVASVAETIKSTLVKVGVDKALDTARKLITDSLGEIADTGVFRIKETAIADGIDIGIGESNFRITVTSDGIDVVSTVNGEEIDGVALLKDIADPETIQRINEISSDVYGKIIESIKNGADPSEIKKTIEFIIENPDKYKTAYGRLKNLKKACESVETFDEILKSYEKVIESTTDNGKSLKDNLEACGVINPKYCFCAHHIVAKNEPLAKQSVDILLKYEIDIDSACNGVYLPGGKKTNNYSRVIDEANHFGGHSYNYLNYVNDELKKCDDELSEIEVPEDKIQEFKEMARKKVCDTLNKIRNQLLNGEIKIQNNETIK